MHLTPGVVHNFTKAVDISDFNQLCTNKIPDFALKRAGGNPKSSDLSSQQ